MTFRISFLLLAVFFMAGCRNSQPSTPTFDYDSLQNFSYLVTSVKTTNNTVTTTPVGTGFFIRFNGSLFFITAKHLFSQINPFNRSINPTLYDTLGVRYFRKSDNKPAFFLIKIDSIRKSLTDKYFYEEPDVYVYPVVGGILNSKVNTIEKTITGHQKSSETPDSILIYGYPRPNPEAAVDFEQIQPTRFSGSPANEFHKDPYDPAGDSLNYEIQPVVNQGMAGASVFHLYSKIDNGQRVEWINFGGLAFGSDTKYNLGYVVRPDIVIQEISKVLFKSPIAPPH